MLIRAICYSAVLILTCHTIEQASELNCDFQNRACAWVNASAGIEDHQDWYYKEAVTVANENFLAYGEKCLVNDGDHKMTYLFSCSQPRQTPQFLVLATATNNSVADSFIYTAGHNTTTWLVSPVISGQYGIGTLFFSYWRSSETAALFVCGRIPSGYPHRLDCSWFRSKDLLDEQDQTMWSAVSVQIPANNVPFEIVIVAHFGSEVGVVAIDDIHYDALIVPGGEVLNRLGSLNKAVLNNFLPQLLTSVRPQTHVPIASSQRHLHSPPPRLTSHSHDISPMMTHSTRHQQPRQTHVEHGTNLNTKIYTQNVMPNKGQQRSLFAHEQPASHIHKIGRAVVAKPDLFRPSVGPASTPRLFTEPAPRPIRHQTETIGPEPTECWQVNCDFDEQLLCSYQTGTNGWRYSMKHVGNRITGVKGDFSRRSNGGFMYAKFDNLESGHVANQTLTSMPFHIEHSSFLRFAVHIGGHRGRLRICQVSEYSEILSCQILVHLSEHTFKPQSRGWHVVEVELRPGTHQLAFVADELHGGDYVLALDSIRLFDAHYRDLSECYEVAF